MADKKVEYWCFTPEARQQLKELQNSAGGPSFDALVAKSSVSRRLIVAIINDGSRTRYDKLQAIVSAFRKVMRKHDPSITKLLDESWFQSAVTRAERSPRDEQLERVKNDFIRSYLRFVRETGIPLAEGGGDVEQLKSIEADWLAAAELACRSIESGNETVSRAFQNSMLALRNYAWFSSWDPRPLMRLAERAFAAQGQMLARAECVMSVAMYEQYRSNFLSATEHYREAANLFQELGEASWQAEAIRCIGEIAWLQGDVTTARPLFDEALKLAEGDAIRVGLCLRNLADADRLEGKLDSATNRYRAAILIFETEGHPNKVVDCERGLIEMEVPELSPEGARAAFQELAARYDKLQDHSSACHTALRAAEITLERLLVSHRDAEELYVAKLLLANVMQRNDYTHSSQMAARCRLAEGAIAYLESRKTDAKEILESALITLKSFGDQVHAAKCRDLLRQLEAKSFNV